MKRNYFTFLCLTIIGLFTFSSFIKDRSHALPFATTSTTSGATSTKTAATGISSGSFTIEDKKYTATYFFHHLPDLKNSEPYFDMTGWISRSSPYYGTYYIAIIGRTLPATGVYPLQDFAKTGQASFLISTPNPDAKQFRAQSGELHVTNNGGSITATFTNVPVKSDVGNFTSVASGTITIKL
ncbi:MAG TPA: hypothetical protein VK609_18940 [Mucilaginibacter sp.]|nr:hypothetical protein [Mucilaginibacter sp.]